MNIVNVNMLLVVFRRSPWTLQHVTSFSYVMNMTNFLIFRLSLTRRHLPNVHLGYFVICPLWLAVPFAVKHLFRVLVHVVGNLFNFAFVSGRLVTVPIAIPYTSNCLLVELRPTLQILVTAYFINTVITVTKGTAVPPHS